MSSIFIYGGCVTRDTFEHIKSQHTLRDYVARQSLISAASPAITLPGQNALTSSFQSRTVEADLRSSLFQSMRRHASNTDLMIVDLLSDRLGVFSMDEGAYITRSAELERSGRLGELRPKFIKFGTDRHFGLWKSSFAKFSRAANASGMWSKIVVLEATWAAKTESGSDTPKFRDMDASTGNQLFERYYDHVRRSELPIITIPAELAVGANEHKWGPAPYHYVDKTYAWLTQEFKKYLPGS